MPRDRALQGLPWCFRRPFRALGRTPGRNVAFVEAYTAAQSVGLPPLEELVELVDEQFRASWRQL